MSRGNSSGEPALTTRIISRVATVASGIVLTAAGVYVVVYLARWEWNRAIVAATVFIAMLQVVSTAVIASRLRDLSSRSGVVVVHSSGSEEGNGMAVGGDRGIESEVDVDTLDSSVLAALQAAGEQRARRHFEWLRADSGTVGVFVPVLLGTGMILSAVAWLVERIAGVVAGHSVDRATARSAPLHMPLAAGRTDPADALTTRTPLTASAVSRRRHTTAFLAAVLLAVAGIGVESVRRLTQSVPDTGTGGQTVLEIAVRTKKDRPPADVAAALWGVCRERLDGLPHAVVAVADGNVVTLLVDRSLQRTAQRRVIGCIEDFTIDGVLATVVRLEADARS
ncbi:MAG: hypothetical protein ACKOAZ_07475 [Ilumatobacteraceae bacterium]